MKVLKKSMALIAALLLCCALLPTVVMAGTSEKKTVYVITEVKVKEGKQTTGITLTYTKNGLLKSIDSTFVDERVKETFSYKSGTCLLTQHTNKILIGPHKGDNSKTQYTYAKNGLRSAKVEKGDDWSNTTTYKYNSKGVITSYDNGHDVTSLAYKNGHVKKAVGSNMTYAAAQDKKGNITKWERKFGKEKIGYADNTFTYDKNGRVKKLKRTYKPNPMGSERTQLLAYTYTKMTVPADYVKTIEEQQWQYINDVPNQSLVAFAW